MDFGFLNELDHTVLPGAILHTQAAKRKSDTAPEEKTMDDPLQVSQGFREYHSGCSWHQFLQYPEAGRK